MARHAAAVLPSPDFLPYPGPHDVPPETVGADVVLLASQVEWHESQGLDPSGYEVQLHESLDAVRAQMRDLPETEKVRADGYAHSLLADVVPDQPVASFLDWLCRRKNGDKLLLMLRRHVPIVAEQTEAAPPLIEAQEWRFIAGITTGIVDGWVSSDAIQRVNAARSVPVTVGDFWLTHRQGYSGGYFDRNNDSMVLAQGLGSTREQRLAHLKSNIAHSYIHEKSHVAFGWGLSYEELWGFDEAMATHVDMAIRNGEPDVLDPKARSNDHGYHWIRRLNAYMAASGPKGWVDPFYLTRAYTSGSTQNADWQAMDREFSRAWGVEGAFTIMWSFFNRHARAVRASHPELDHEQAWNQAAQDTMSFLRDEPQRVFGEPYHQPRSGRGRFGSYQKPRHLGAAAVANKSMRLR